MDTNIEIAYWAVVKNLEPGAEIPVAVLEKARPYFIAESGSSRAGEVIYQHLRGISWDWPAWYQFAKVTGRKTLRDISSSVASLEPHKVFMMCTISALKAIAREADIKLPGSAGKPEIASTLSAEIDSRLEKFVSTVRCEIVAQEHDKCRREMARFIGVRIMCVTYNMDRYEQLSEFPYWGFTWGGGTDAGTPASCRRFDKGILPVGQAQSDFPILPCDHLLCNCHISGLRKEKWW